MEDVFIKKAGWLAIFWLSNICPDAFLSVMVFIGMGVSIFTPSLAGLGYIFTSSEA